MEASRGFVIRETGSLEMGQLNAAKSKFHVSLRAVVHIGIPHSCVSGHVVEIFSAFRHVCHFLAVEFLRWHFQSIG